MSERIYITTTLPYVNADPHIGFALEIVHADIVARYHTLLGHEVFFNTGTDEHGLKIYRKAQEEGMKPQAYVDAYAAKFKELKQVLGLSEGINFIRTTNPHHKAAAQEFWRRCATNGFIYKKPYRVRYCVGCELEKTDSELERGKCPLHPTLEVEVIEEENYFFKFSVFQEYLLEHYAQHPDFVVPGFRFNEIKAFVARGLEDFSISRRKDKMPWGVPVPNDDSQVMYVWFDALVNYISALGWPEDEANFKEWWVDTGGVVQCAGKDQVRQQAAMWQAMLKAAGLPPSKQIVIHGFITSGGQKMSKSLGNAADPVALVREYGTDALRWYLARHIHPFEDSDFTMEKFRETYNADLANGVGNVVSRVMKMAVDYRVAPPAFSDKMERMRGLEKYINGYDIKAAAEVIFGAVVNIDRHIQEHEPYKMYKSNPDAAREVVQKLVLKLYEVGVLIEPILPATGVEIQRLVRENTMPVVPLFPRKS